MMKKNKASASLPYFKPQLPGGGGGGGIVPLSPPVSSAVIVTWLVSLLLLEWLCAGHANARKSAKNSSNMILKFKRLINPAGTRNLVPGIAANRVRSASYIFGKWVSFDRGSFYLLPKPGIDCRARCS
jgi:hypothetical protein